MGALVGHRSGRIEFVGNSAASPDLEYIELPSGLNATPTEVMADFEVRHGVLQPKGTKRRVALVSVFGVTCGISTYSGWLWGEMSKLVEEGHVFAEREDGAPDMAGVTRCWKRGEPLSELVREINAHDPDVVIVQHEYGIFPDARHFLSFMGAMAGRRVIVVLHSVYAAHRDKTIVEASCPEIVVHTESARQVLRAKGISAPIYVIPHGSPSPDPGRLWNLYRSAHTFCQWGFAFDYKGYDQALRVVAELKPDYPDIFFTALLSERTPGASSAPTAALQRLARELDIEEHVGLVRGFQTEQVLDSFLRTNAVAIFPYRDNGEHTVHGTSGAARLTMSKGLPVAVSTVPLFDDLEGVCPRRSSVEDFAETIASFFDARIAREQVERQSDFLNRTLWEHTALAYTQL